MPFFLANIVFGVAAIGRLPHVPPRQIRSSYPMGPQVARPVDRPRRGYASPTPLAASTTNEDRGVQGQKHYTYRLTCYHPASPHKYYYGVRTCNGDPVKDNYWSSSELVKDAIALFGLDFFTKKVTGVYATREAAMLAEIKLHDYLDVKNHPLFFNRANQTSTKFVTPKGDLPLETRAKIAESARARYAAMGPEERVISEDHKAKIAAARQGTLHSPETKAKIRVSLQAKMAKREVSLATRSKMAAAARARYAKISPKERSLSSETKAKIADAQRRRWAAEQDTKHTVKRTARDPKPGTEPDAFDRLLGSGILDNLNGRHK